MLSDTSVLAQKLLSCFGQDGEFIQIVVRASAHAEDEMESREEPQQVAEHGSVTSSMRASSVAKARMGGGEPAAKCAKVAVNMGAKGESGAQTREDTQQVFLVWSKLLSAWSDVFAAMLRSECRERAEKRIEIVDFSAKAVDGFLRFLYSGQLDVGPGLLLEVGALADKYVVTRLQELCAEGVGNALNAKSACELLAASDRVGSTALREQCMQRILSDPEEALPSAFLLQPLVLDEVLSSPRLCIGDNALALLLLEWARNPAAASYKGEVPELLKRHVHIAALTEDEQGKLKNLAQTVGCGEPVQDLIVRARRGKKTANFFHTLWQMYTDRFPTDNRPPFIGYWLNVIHADPAWFVNAQLPDLHDIATGVTSRGYRAGGARGMPIECNAECTWMSPHHAIHVTGISFERAIGKDCEIEVLCSANSVEWDLLLDSTIHTRLKESASANAGIKCRSGADAKWFKVRVLKGSYSHALRIQGIVQEQ